MEQNYNLIKFYDYKNVYFNTYEEICGLASHLQTEEYDIKNPPFSPEMFEAEVKYNYPAFDFAPLKKSYDAYLKLYNSYSKEAQDVWQKQLGDAQRNIQPHVSHGRDYVDPHENVEALLSRKTPK